MGKRMFRPAWVAVQEDGCRVTLSSTTTDDFAAARTDADEAASLPYVEEAWVEWSEWLRVDSPATVSAPAEGAQP